MNNSELLLGVNKTNPRRWFLVDTAVDSLGSIPSSMLCAAIISLHTEADFDKRLEGQKRAALEFQPGPFNKIKAQHIQLNPKRELRESIY